MSVLKANRKPSPFEVEHHAYKVRTVITDLALRNFGLKEYEERPKPIVEATVNVLRGKSEQWELRVDTSDLIAAISPYFCSVYHRLRHQLNLTVVPSPSRSPIRTVQNVSTRL